MDRVFIPGFDLRQIPFKPGDSMSDDEFDVVATAKRDIAVHGDFSTIKALYSAMPEIPQISGFEICLHKADGSISMKMTVNAFGPYDAQLQAERMLKDNIAYAVIWKDLIEVATVHRDVQN